MKLRTQTLSLLILAVAGLLLSNCGGGGNETPKEKVELGKLSKTWTIVSAEVNNDGINLAADVDPAFNDMTLTISGTYSSAADAEYNYTVGGTLPSPSPWPKPGQSANKWSFVSAEEGMISRDPGTDDELGMFYSIANGQLMITFTVDAGSEGWAGGKTANVVGQWVFIFE